MSLPERAGGEWPSKKKKPQNTREQNQLPGFLPWAVIMDPCQGLQELWWTEGRSARRGGLEPPFSEPSQEVLHEVLPGKVHANSARLTVLVGSCTFQSQHNPSRKQWKGKMHKGPLTFRYTSPL